MQSRETRSLLIRRTTRTITRDTDDGDGTSSEPSSTSEDMLVSPPLGTEIASDIDPTADAVEGNTVDWIVDAAVPGGNPPLGVQTRNRMLQRTAEQDSTTSMVHSGGKR
jgi:hypothetical protein